MSALAVVRTALRTPRLTAGTFRAFHVSARRNDYFLDANAETFQKAIANKDKIVLVDFYADWCGPCKMLSPVLEKVTKEDKSGSGKALDLVTVDTDVEMELAKQYQISSLPTVIAFNDGKPVSQFVGALPEGVVRQFLKAL